jgi:lipopolysaccharide/colanic/teichoic acid biosynthesis glycosyltransferase
LLCDSRGPSTASAAVTGTNTDGSRAVGKRVIDVVGASTLLILLLPILLVVAVSIKIDSRGPLLYRSRRIGRRGVQFDMLKFRKMHSDAAGPALTSTTDERFTRVGSLLARTKLDELPQLWNVVRGDMSLVGPRPEDPSFVSIYPEAFGPVHTVRPGITGLSQIAFAEEGRVLDVPDPMRRYVEGLLPQKLGLDELYVARRSIGMDLRILLWTTLTVVFNVEVSVNRASGQFTVRRRPPVAVPRATEKPATSDEFST